MRKVKVTKLSDDKFKGEHPNGINAGFIAEGIEMGVPEVGLCYYIEGLRTSTVIEIIDEFTFKTLNSTYKIEVLE